MRIKNNLEESKITLTSYLQNLRFHNSKFLHKDIQNALPVIDYPLMEIESDESDTISKQLKRKRCSACGYSKDRKVPNKSYIDVQHLYVKNIM